MFGDKLEERISIIINFIEDPNYEDIFRLIPTLEDIKEKLWEALHFDIVGRKFTKYEQLNKEEIEKVDEYLANCLRYLLEIKISGLGLDFNDYELNQLLAMVNNLNMNKFTFKFVIEKIIEEDDILIKKDPYKGLLECRKIFHKSF